MPKAVAQELGKRIPMQRYGRVQDIADAGVFLFSSAASYITGAALVVDGGEYHTSSMSAILPYPDTVLNGGDFRKLLAAKL